MKEMKPDHDFFIGIDSDGCVFDTMEIKQKECFCPNFIKYFGLQKISKYARETWEFVNLYSKTRGVNRFLALLESVRLLSERKETAERGASMPDLTPLEEWTKKESKLGNPALKEYAAGAGDPMIDLTLNWSEKVNADIAEMVHGIPPFPFVGKVLASLPGSADVMVVSQTPVEALQREWNENGIDKYVRIIAGQEYGTKAEHIALAAKGKYPDDRILMVGDAPGDLRAAKKNGVLFFPVNPGHEEISWKRFFEEGMDTFLSGQYAGSYEAAMIREFESYLPERPPWEENLQSKDRLNH